MQRYHLEVEGILEYINMLKDAQKQAGQAGLKIANKTLLLFSKTAMLTTERFPRINNEAKINHQPVTPVLTHRLWDVQPRAC